MAWQCEKNVAGFFPQVCCVVLVLACGFTLSSGSDAFPVVFPDASAQAGDVMRAHVSCEEDVMRVTLPSGPLDHVRVLGSASIESVLKAPATCGYSLTLGRGHLVLLVKYTGCHVKRQHGLFSITVIYMTNGHLDAALLTCEDQDYQLPVPGRVDGQQLQPPCANLPLSLPELPEDNNPPSPSDMLLLNSSPAGCAVSGHHRVRCGSVGISHERCLAKGCCFHPGSSACYYPMDECTADRHFVFAVHYNFSNIPVNPTSLVVGGKNGCKPVHANHEAAVFKFSVTECGTRSFVIGDTTVYLAEVQTVSKVLNLKYGLISRDNPVRLVVECRYTKHPSPLGLSGPVLTSAGYMVMSPHLPPHLDSEGLFGVQLLLSHDERFTRFYPHCNLPLGVLLGKPLYLELRLKSPKPEATLLVHYCVAYPRSAKSALILLYEGCPNHLDEGNVSVLYMKHLPQNQHQRRFEVKAFQFMDLSSRKYLNEEIYFMCSTEVCFSSDEPCVQTCFDGKVHEKL